MKRLSIAAGIVLCLAFAGMIADTALTAQHPCEQCGEEMRPFESGSSIYKCTCGFMEDDGFQN